MRTRTIASAIACSAIATTSASAHVTLSPSSASADSMIEARFDVGHGCDSAATVALRVKIPEGVFAVKPQMKAGWRIEIKRRELTQPSKSERGRAPTTVVDEVEWIGGPLPNDLYDEFTLRMWLPDQAGKTLYFPVVQQCEKGETRWIEIPAEGKEKKDLREPAPALLLLPNVR
jgi:uncharacterized protein YcnI